MRTLSRLVFIGGLLLAAATFDVHGAASTTLGSSAATRCFEDSRFSLSVTSLEFCDRAIKQGELTRRDLAATFSNRGIIHGNLGNYNQALADQNRAIELMPRLGEAYINRGNVYFHTRDFEKAIADYDMALSIGAKPEHTILYNKALTLIRLKDITRAREALEAALEYKPDSKKIKQRLGELKDL